MEEGTDLTLCRIEIAQRFDKFIFTQLKIDTTPSMLKGRGTIYWAEPTYNHFYIFKYDLYPYLSNGAEIEIDLENYDFFTTNNNCKVFYDKHNFSSLDIVDLHTYSFGR